MLPDSNRRRASKAWRAIYLVSTLLVFSYVLFEVLDLDGSNFPLKQFALERAAVVAEVVKDTVGAYAVEKAALPDHLFTAFFHSPGEAMWIRLTRVLSFSSLKSLRTHRYRIALPRSSPSDPFPLP
jgi:hypothetical protein